MKKYLVLITLIALIAAAGAAILPQFSPISIGKSNTGGIPNFYTVESENIRLTVTDSGLFGGTDFGGGFGLFYHLTSPQVPDHHGGAYALNSNPTNQGGYYGNNWNHTATMPAPAVMLPSGLSSASVSYWAHWNIENDFDGVQLEIATSTDNYTTWTGLQPTGTVAGSGLPGQPSGGYYYEGVVGGYGIFSQYTCDLTSYIGKSIKLRFHLRTDPSIVYTGFTVDDLQILGNGVALATYGFEGGPTMWVTDGYWGQTVQSLWSDNMMFKGEVIAGMSSAYVASYYGNDWQPFGVWLGPPLHIRVTNRWTVPSGQPKFDLDMYFYAPSGSTGGTYVIVDCYLKRVDSTAITNLFIADHMEPVAVALGWDQALYDSAHQMAWVHYQNDFDKDCIGLMHLAPGAANPYSVSISQNPWFGNDAQLYSLLSQGTVDNPGSTVYWWYTTLSSGPFSTSDFLPQPDCGVVRHTFAFVVGGNSTEIYNNAAACRLWYNNNLASNPQGYVTVESRTLGTLKAMYK